MVEIPWFYVDDAFADSKPVMRLDDRLRNEAVGLWTRCGAWSAKEETDGVVPLDIVRQFGGTSRIVRGLVADAVLWEVENLENWRKNRQILFKNWSKWQKTRAENVAKRKADAERQAEHRRAKKGRNFVDLGTGLNSEDMEMSRCDSGQGNDTSSGAASKDVSRCESQRPDPTRPVVVTLGGECAVGSRDGLPPRFCDEHPEGTTRGCGGCRDARLRLEAAEAEQARDELDAKRRQRDAAANCPVCGGTNWVPDTDPAVRCRHA